MTILGQMLSVPTAQGLGAAVRFPVQERGDRIYRGAVLLSTSWCALLPTKETAILRALSLPGLQPLWCSCSLLE